MEITTTKGVGHFCKPDSKNWHSVTWIVQGSTAKTVEVIEISKKKINATGNATGAKSHKKI